MNLKTHVGTVQSAPRCPLCWQPSRVAFMRVDADGRLHRRRVCVNRSCHKAFWTVEEVTADPPITTAEVPLLLGAAGTEPPCCSSAFLVEMQQAIDAIGMKA